MDIKIVLATLSTIIGIACFAPYIRDIFRNTTKPHAYTWLIWSILQFIAVAAMWSAGAGIAVASSAVGVVLCAFIFVLSIWRGTKNITTFDTICLMGAFCALGVFFFLHNALLSIILVTLIDVFGFLPTFRKTFEEPGTETASTHFLSALANVLAIAALATFSLTTTLYLAVIMILDCALGLLVVVRSGGLRKSTTL